MASGLRRPGVGLHRQLCRAAIIDHRYRAVFFPGDGLATELAQRFHAVTDQGLGYVIGDMWDGGNLEHYSPNQPRG